MLEHNDVVATIAVQDMDRARAFYEGTLGLKPVNIMGEEVATYTAGDSKVFVYKSHRAGGYGATVATWTVEDHIEDLVEELHSRGIEFEHYKDLPDVELRGDIHINGDMKAAWFKDPDENILCLVQSRYAH